jgi:hypothetical protein
MPQIKPTIDIKTASSADNAVSILIVGFIMDIN